MSDDELTRLYAQLARKSEVPAGGIGLDLITRLCDHLGWTLQIAALSDKGLRATLRFPE